VKIMSKLDISEKRLPQDGRIRFGTTSGEPKEIDFRCRYCRRSSARRSCSVCSTRQLMLDMTKLGFEAESLAKFESAIARPWGWCW